MKKFDLITILFALLAVVCIGCSGSDSADMADTQTAQATPATPTIVDQPGADAYQHPAMNVSAVDLDGQTHQFSEWIGNQPVVINLWGTWCPPCRREIPGLVRLYDEYRNQGVEILGLAIERRAGPQQVKQFVERADMQWPQLMANEQVAQAFGYSGSVPMTIFLDRNGREVARHVGARQYNVFKLDFERVVSGS